MSVVPSDDIPRLLTFNQLLRLLDYVILDI